MLINRNLTVSLGTLSIRGVRLTLTIGRVFFPLLWCLVMNELLVGLRKAGFLVFGYADDVAIVAKGNFLSNLKECIDDTFRIIWCKIKDPTVNPFKTKTMIFTRKYKPEAIEPLKL